MPNHFHLVLWPRGDGDLSRWMQWLLTSHVRRYHRHYHGSGHVWQGRFKAFPIEQDEHLLTVLRYVERNPAAGRPGATRRSLGLVEPWLGGRLASVRSCCRRLAGALPAKLAGSGERDRNRGGTGGVTSEHCSGAPFGDERWSRRVAIRLGLDASLRPRGRPKKSKK